VIRLCAIACLAACTIPLGDGERRITARELATDVIVPTLDDVVARATELRVAIEALPADGAREAWRAARVPWKQADAFRFGPAKDLSLAAAIDQAIEPSRVDAELAGSATFTDAYVDTIGANKKGFHAIEYVIFGDVTDPRRRELAIALAQNLERKARELRDAWASDYATKLAEPGSANATFPTIKAVIDALANESVFQAELVADARIGKPMGTATGGVPQPDLEESGPSDNSIADMADSLRGVRNIYTGSRGGTPGRGIGKLVVAQSRATDRDVQQALAAAIAAVEAIPRPYRTALVDNHPSVQAAHDAVKELKRILGTEVIAVLGATLSFNDNDGD
jgi:predicted lipoprotein